MSQSVNPTSSHEKGKLFRGSFTGSEPQHRTVPRGLSQLFSLTTLQTSAWQLFTQIASSLSLQTLTGYLQLSPCEPLGVSTGSTSEVLGEGPTRLSPLQDTLGACRHPDLIKGSHGSLLGFNSWFKWFIKLKETLYFCLLTG